MTVATFALYLLVLFVIGAAGYRRTSNLADYILGGRRMGKWVTALSTQASDMSGWLLLGLPGLAYAAGLEAGWMVFGLLAGTYLNWKWVARRLRETTENLGNTLTLPEYFERRFGDKRKVLRTVTALAVLIFFTVYVSSGLVAGGRLFESVFGLPYLWAIGLGALVVLLYTFAGGFFAVSWTDFFQALLMLFALVAAALFGIGALGGLAGTGEAMDAANPNLKNPFTGADGEALGAVGILSLLGWGLGYFGQPHILARFMAIRNPLELVFSRRVAMTWVTVCLLAAVTVGIAGIGVLETPLENSDKESIFIVMAPLLFHPLVAGVCLAAILAAVMSTVDSQLLVASSTVTEDLYRQILRPGAGATEMLWVSRSAVAAIAVLAFFFAMDPETQVLNLVAYAWAGFGATFGPAILLSLYWPRMNGIAAAAGILTGGITVVVWARLEGGLFELYELVPAFLLSTAAIVAVTLQFPRQTT